MYIVIIILLLALLLLNKDTIEMFALESCDLNDNKIDLLNQKINMESELQEEESSKNIHIINEKIKSINERLVLLDAKIENESSLYGELTVSNKKIYKNYLIVGFIVTFGSFLVLVLLYQVLIWVKSKQSGKIKKLDLSYDKALKEVKKSILKNKLK